MAQSPLHIYVFRREDPPATKDWSQMTIQLLKHPDDASSFPTLTAIANLHDTAGGPLGLVGPLPLESGEPNALEQYTCNWETDTTDRGYTSAQPDTSRACSACGTLVRVLRGAYGWLRPQDTISAALLLRDTLQASLRRVLPARLFETLEFEPEDYLFALPLRHRTPEGRLKVFREAAWAYTNQYLMRNMLSSLDPDAAGAWTPSMSYVRAALICMSAVESHIHDSVSLPLCMAESGCKVTSYMSAVDCTAFRESMESLGPTPADLCDIGTDGWGPDGSASV